MNLGGLGKEPQIASLNLNKGMSLDLSKYSHLKNVRFGLGWKAGNGQVFDLDASAFMLDDRRMIVGDPHKYVVYYNQLDTGIGVKSLGDNRVGSTGNDKEDDDEVIIVNLDKVPNEVKSILFVVTIDKSRERRQNFGMVKNAYIRCVDDDTDEELGKYNLAEQFSLQTSVEIGILNRTSHGWEFIAVGEGYTEDLNAVLLRHGCQ